MTYQLSRGFESATNNRRKTNMAATGEVSRLQTQVPLTTYRVGHLPYIRSMY